MVSRGSQQTSHRQHSIRAVCGSVPVTRDDPVTTICRPIDVVLDIFGFGSDCFVGAAFGVPVEYLFWRVHRLHLVNFNVILINSNFDRVPVVSVGMY